MTPEQLDQLALEVAKEVDSKYPWNMNQEPWVCMFAQNLIAKMQEKMEPVGHVNYDECDPIAHLLKHVPAGTDLYTLPLIKEKSE